MRSKRVDIPLTIEVWKKGKWFIANCPELDFVSQGRTVEEAKKNIKEVIGIQFEEMKEAGTLPDEFQTIEEAAKFWDNHSLSDYEDCQKDVEFEVDLKSDC